MTAARSPDLVINGNCAALPLKTKGRRWCVSFVKGPEGNTLSFCDGFKKQRSEFMICDDVKKKWMRLKKDCTFINNIYQG